MRAPFRIFPAELTMLNDLSFNTEAWRKKQPFGDTEGDAHKGWPPDPKAYWLYFPDAGTFGKEAFAGAEGFWLRRGAHAQVFLRSLEPVTHMSVRVLGGAGGDYVDVRAGRQSRSLVVAAGQQAEVDIQPGPGLLYYDSFVYDLELRSTGSPPDGSERAGERSVFVEIALQVEKRPRP